MMLVTLAQAKAHLRVDTDYEDADLALKIEGASVSVWEYIKDGVDGVWLDSAGLPIEDSAGYVAGVPQNIVNATLILLGDLYKERDGANTSEWDHGFLPRVVLSLLYPYRLPTLA